MLLRLVVDDPNPSLTCGRGPPTEGDSFQGVRSLDRVVDCTVDFRAGGTGASSCF
jgi:hypothetical protein